MRPALRARLSAPAGACALLLLSMRGNSRSSGLSPKAGTRKKEIVALRQEIHATRQALEPGQGASR